MTDKKKELLIRGLKAMDNAYAPYSGFSVGACLIDNSGNFFIGCNVENIASPLTTCAEANAITTMIATKGTHSIIREILVCADTNADEFCTPCGGCRQRIKEFASLDCLIHVANKKDGILRSFTLAELLPYSFTYSKIV